MTLPRDGGEGHYYAMLSCAYATLCSARLRYTMLGFATL